MAYEKQTWANGDLITAEKLNHMEDGIAQGGGGVLTVNVTVTEDAVNEEGVIVFHLHVAEDDMGRVIGKQGRIAKAIRTVMRAAANRTGDKVMVEID